MPWGTRRPVPQLIEGAAERTCGAGEHVRALALRSRQRTNLLHRLRLDLSAAASELLFADLR